MDISVQCSSLPVPDTKFQEAKSDYSGQLIVTPEMVAKKIKAMKDNKSPGVDGIPPKLLMETVEQIRIPLARVFNLSLKEGVVPFEWKEANIIIICGLTTLETRRLRVGEKVFRTLNGYKNIDIFFSPQENRTRGHQVTLVKDRCRFYIRKYSFSQRTINEWNKLSTDCATASSVNV